VYATCAYQDEAFDASSRTLISPHTNLSNLDPYDKLPQLGILVQPCSAADKRTIVDTTASLCIHVALQS
jgi:hypothetical protein